MKRMTYKDCFTVAEEIGDLYVCTAFTNGNETCVKKIFLEAHFVTLGDSFECEVDTGGCILLETIKIFE